MCISCLIEPKRGRQGLVGTALRRSPPRESMSQWTDDLKSTRQSFSVRFISFNPSQSDKSAE